MAHILLPTDFSTNALNAAKYAINLFGTEGNTFTVLHSYMLPHSSASTMWSIDDMMARDSRESMDLFIARMRTELGHLKPALTGVCEHGDLPNVVQRFASHAASPDAVVMGTQGASGLKEVLLGSNTADVVRHGHLPVIAVPENNTYRTPKRIILADDGGPVNKATVKLLLDIARWSQAEVLIVRVVNDDTAVEEGGNTVYDTLLGAIPHSYHYLSSDDVSKALHDMADQNDADLVVLVHRQRGLFDQLFHRSTASRLAMHTHIPMLVLQQPAD
jgi:nucleotide-binding universal stress UspA family protein